MKALYLRLEDLVKEMIQRGYKHKSPQEKRMATGGGKQREYVDPPDIQRKILRKKKCGCRV